MAHPAGAGIPFVLEIWPAGHNSPIHNHGNAYGIVRVLHGDITGAHSGRPWLCRVSCAANKQMCTAGMCALAVAGHRPG